MVDALPGSYPSGSDALEAPVRNPLEERGHVEKRMANPTVSPVEEHEAVPIETVVARMEVAVYQGVRKPATVKGIELSGQHLYQMVKIRLLRRGEKDE